MPQVLTPYQDYILSTDYNFYKSHVNFYIVLYQFILALQKTFKIKINYAERIDEFLNGHYDNYSDDIFKFAQNENFVEPLIFKENKNIPNKIDSVISANIYNSKIIIFLNPKLIKELNKEIFNSNLEPLFPRWVIKINKLLLDDLENLKMCMILPSKYIDLYTYKTEDKEFISQFIIIANFLIKKNLI